MMIRDASTADAQGVLDIYGPVIQETSISFEMEIPSTTEMEARIRQSTWRSPWLVAEEAGQISGYVYARPFRSRKAYQFSAETTVYIHPDFRGQGLGRRLMQHLLNRLISAGHETVVAGVTIPNEASVKLHEGLGFQSVGTFPRVGRKFSVWHDVGFWSLALRETSVELTPDLAPAWRLRYGSAESQAAKGLLQKLSAELASRYQDFDGAGDFDPAAGDAGQVFVLGWYNDEPVACGAARPFDETTAELKRVFVQPAFRQRGFASQLVERLELEASKLGFQSICLETGDLQHEAVELYTKMHYDLVPAFGKYKQSPNAICFRKAL